MPLRFDRYPMRAHSGPFARQGWPAGGRLPQSTVACLSMPSSIAAAPGCLGAICRSALATFASFICTIRAGADRTRSSVRQRVFQAMVQDADNE